LSALLAGRDGEQVKNRDDELNINIVVHILQFYITSVLRSRI
jgi:hypothetical protein